MARSTRRQAQPFPQIDHPGNPAAPQRTGCRFLLARGWRSRRSAAGHGMSAPAICSILESLPEWVRAHAFILVPTTADAQAGSSRADIELAWITGDIDGAVRSWAGTPRRACSFHRAPASSRCISTTMIRCPGFRQSCRSAMCAPGLQGVRSHEATQVPSRQRAGHRPLEGGLHGILAPGCIRRPTLTARTDA